MTIFRLNFLLKVAHILVCQNPSFISTEEDYGTAGAVLLSWIFSGLGIRQFSVYVVFCNKGVI